MVAKALEQLVTLALCILGSQNRAATKPVLKQEALIMEMSRAVRSEVRTAYASRKKDKKIGLIGKELSISACK